MGKEEVWAFVKTSVMFYTRLSGMVSVEIGGGVAMDAEQFGPLLDQETRNPRSCSDIVSNSKSLS